MGNLGTRLATTSGVSLGGQPNIVQSFFAQSSTDSRLHRLLTVNVCALSALVKVRTLTLRREVTHAHVD